MVLAKDGLPGAGHPLFHTAGLAVLNDGAFTASDAHSITSLGTSNKASQAGTAGKFGLGLKSIFHWSEVFFYFSPHPFSPIDGNQATHCGLYNPWCSPDGHDGRHLDWEEDWPTTRARDREAFGQLARQLLNSERWFGLWIPLRQSQHLQDNKGEVKPIEQRFPDADLDKLFGKDWQTRLAETLPLLRRLRTLRICELQNQDLVERAHVVVAERAQRIRFGVERPTTAPFRQTLSGSILSEANRAPVCGFAGMEQLTHLESLQEIKRLNNWPYQTAIMADGAEEQLPEKAEPYGAVVFTRRTGHNQGGLRVQPAVFLPLGEPKETPCDGQGRYNLYLHGLFFGLGTSAHPVL